MLDSFTRDDGCELYYQLSGEGPAVVFLHGFSGNHLSWWQQIPAFDEDYTCIAPDQRGFGLSADIDDGPGPEAFVADLRALLDHLERDRAVIVGHSMSGWPAASFATRYPSRVVGLVLSGSPAGLLSPSRHQEILETDDDDPPDDIPLSRAEQFLSTAITELNLHAPEEFADIRPRLDALAIDTTAFNDADFPVLLVAGAADPFMPEAALDAVADRLEDVTTATIDDALHSANFEQPGAFNDQLRRFLEDAVAG